MGPELVQETVDKVKVIQDQVKISQVTTKAMEGDHVFLGISSRKGVMLLERKDS